MCNRFIRSHNRSLLRLLSILWLMSGLHIVMAQQDDHLTVQAVNTPFQVSEYMMSGIYRYPDKQKFGADKWWKGLSISTYWYPKLLNFQTKYDGFELNSAGIALTKDFNKSCALRLGFGYNHNRMEFMMDYQWNLSNFWYGYNPARKFEWLATVGLTGGIVEIAEAHRRFYGGQVGLQLRHTLSPRLSLYIEPQYKAVSPLYDHTWKRGNIVDDGLALQVGLITRLSSPQREGGYGEAVVKAASAIGRVSKKLFFDHGMKMNRYNTLHRWYVELLGGTQLRCGERNLSNLSLYQFEMEMTIGAKLNNFFALQVGAYEERLDLTQKSEYPETVYGYRAELTVNPMRLLWRQSEDKGLVWTIGGGYEAGRVELWDHTHTTFLQKYIKPTFHTQLRYRLFGQTWLALQGRMQKISVDDDDLQMTAYLGMHYELKARKSGHRRNPAWWNGFWISGAWGAWDMKNGLVNAGIGYDFNDVHSLRLDYVYSHQDSHNSYLDKIYLNLFSVDYMMNIRNALVGYDAKRRFDVYMFAGYNLAVHNQYCESFWHAYSYIGMEGGARLSFNLSRHLSLFAEEKTLFILGDPFLTPDLTQSLSMMGTMGLKVKF